MGGPGILKFHLELQGSVCKGCAGPQEFQVFYCSKFQLCGMHKVSTAPHQTQSSIWQSKSRVKPDSNTKPQPLVSCWVCWDSAQVCGMCCTEMALGLGAELGPVLPSQIKGERSQEAPAGGSASP